MRQQLVTDTPADPTQPRKTHAPGCPTWTFQLPIRGCPSRRGCADLFALREFSEPSFCAASSVSPAGALQGRFPAFSLPATNDLRNRGLTPCVSMSG
ncbi:MAG TPA: hypothetical protein DCQ04_15905 [Actinobacteria bacterium]|nr:hypothetical protein [Actinomycetota bacterium]